MISAPFLALVPGGVLAVSFVLWLRRAGYGPAMACGIALLSLLQAGVVLALLRPGHSLWLALAMAAVVGSASAFAEREDVRRIILFGGSLAAIQIADPLGGLLAAGLLPVAVAMGRAGSEPRKTLGLYALLLFVPIMTAAVLLYSSRVLHLDPIHLVAGPAFVPPHPGLGARVLIAVAPALVAAPACIAARHTPGGRAVMLVATGALIAMMFAAVTGTVREPVTLLAVGSPLCVGALAQLPFTARRTVHALAITLSCTGLSWLLIGLSGG